MRWRASHALEIIHSNVCGPLKPMSIEGQESTFSYQYWRFYNKDLGLFLKEKVRWVWSLQFKILVEEQSVFHINVFRSNQGGEYTFKLFENYCKKHGIVHLVIPSCMPQLFGVAKRKNRTILDMA